MTSCCKWITDGVYSCRWRKRNYFHRSERTTLLEIVFFVILTFTFLLSVAWMYSVAVFANESNNVNFFLFNRLRSWFHWFVLILALSVVGITYMFILFISGLFKILKKSLHLFLCHKIFIIIVFALIVIGYVAVGIFYPDVWMTIFSSFDTTGIFLQLCSVILWTCFSIYVGFFLQQFSNLAFKLFTYIFYFIIFALLLTIPIWIMSPCIGSIAYNQTKPLLVGHRGAPTLAPENTNLSFEKSINDCEVSVLESDVRISFDGIPFMLHDQNLLRTTNVADVYPDRKNNRPESFTWQELQNLNAGDWFLETDPFFSVGALTENEKNLIRMQKIPSLLEYLYIAAIGNVSVVFDLFQPPDNHPYRYTWINLTLNIIAESRLPQDKVLWILNEQTESFLNRSDLNFRFVSRNQPSQTLVDIGISIFNLQYTTITSEIISSDYNVISYTINQNWAFSRAWCQGVWAVTTNKCNDFKNLNSPSWTLTHPMYLGLWISLNLFFFILVVIIFLSFEKKKFLACSTGENVQRSKDDIFAISGTQKSLVS